MYLPGLDDGFALVAAVLCLSSSVYHYHGVTRQLEEVRPRQRDLVQATLAPRANVLIAGAQKAGTTAIAQYLLHRQDVCNPKARPGIAYTSKEAHFFDEDEVYSRNKYETLYEHCNQTATNIYLDATPKYMLYPERIYEYYRKLGLERSVKIVFILREPVSRDLSWYNHLRVSLNSRRPQQWAKDELMTDNQRIMEFEEYCKTKIQPSIVQQTNRGNYAHQLKRWFQLFDRKQMFIANYEQLDQPLVFLQRLQHFLGLPGAIRHVPHANHKQFQNKVPIPCALQDSLHQQWQPYNKELYDLLRAHPGPENLEFGTFHYRCKP